MVLLSSMKINFMLHNHMSQSHSILPIRHPGPLHLDETDSLLPQCKFLEHRTPTTSKFNKAKEPLTMSIDWDTMSLQIMLPWVSFPQSVTEDVKLGKNKILKWRTRYGWVSLMTSSLIYFGTDPRKHRIHLFYISNDVKSYVINVSVLW